MSSKLNAKSLKNKYVCNESGATVIALRKKICFAIASSSVLRD